ncbi:MAG: DUF1816 domain-containing protein [Cyanobacteria bacterium J06639_14]
MRFFPLQSRASWWVKIHTEMPQCIYYFGPFTDAQEATSYQPGYIEDLVQEGAQGINTETQKGEPEVLTIVAEFDG